MATDLAALVVYEQRTSGGKAFRCSVRTAAHLDYTKARLAVAHPGAQLVIMQGCYNVGVEASQGTHDKDACLDVRIVGLSWAAAQWFLRLCGWAAFWRTPAQGFVDHIHMVSIGYPGGPSAVGIYVPAQVDDYRRHALGLKGQHDSGDDRSPFPADIDSTIFDFALWEREVQDDMPFTDWPKTDQDALSKSVAAEVVKQLLGTAVATGLTVAQALKQGANAPGLVRKLATALGKKV